MLKYFLKISFEKKIFLSFSLILSFILTFIFIILSLFLIENKQTERLANHQAITQKIQEQLTLAINDLNRVSLGLIYNKSFMYHMQSAEKQLTHYTTINKDIIESCISILGGNIFTDRIVIVNDYTYYTLSNLPENPSHMLSAKQQSPWGESLASLGGKTLFIPPHQDIWSPTPHIVFSLIRNIRDYTGNTYGYIEVTQKYSLLESICAISPEIGQIILLNNSGEIIFPYSSTPIPSLSTFTSELLKDATQIQGELTINKQNIFYDHDSPYGIYVTLLAPTPNYLFTPLFYALLAILLSILFIGIYFTNYFTTKLITPLIKLTSDIQHINLDNLHLPNPQVTSVDEIEQLTTSFHNMINCLSLSIDEAMTAKNNEMLAYYHALEAQTNPHMIYNVIGMIESLSYTNGNSDVAELCIHFSNMLRYTSDFSSKTYTLEDELNHLTHYASLMCKRYEGSLFIYTDIDSSLLKHVLPKLTLQTLVENAIKHGFKDRESIFMVTVSVFQTNTSIHIQVSDTGAGISDDKILEIYNTFNAGDSPQQGIGHLGLINLYSRLHLLFKDNFELTLTHTFPHGCTVIITIGGFYHENFIS